MPVKAEEQKTCRWQSSSRQWGKRVVDCRTDLIEKELENDAWYFKGGKQPPVMDFCRADSVQRRNVETS